MTQERVEDKRKRGRAFRAVILLLGLALAQFILYAPSLTGRKILLPLAGLARPGCYSPERPGVGAPQAADATVSDLILQFEPARRFAVSQLRAGRLPMWAPYHYCGAPFIWPKFSPFMVVQCCSESPVVLAWSQLLMAVVAGSGAYLFFRHSLAVSFWPATICAWCFPLTGFFALWEGFPLLQPVCWLPWLLLAVDRTIARASGLVPIGLAVLTALVLSGQMDLAGQVLLTSGLCALVRLFGVQTSPQVEASTPPTKELNASSPTSMKPEGSFFAKLRRPVLRLSTGWFLGFLLATPFLLPVLEYANTGARMLKRSAGVEERSPVGLEALPQVVLPDMYGTSRQPSWRYGGGYPQQESSAGGYAGALITLFAAPLAFCSRRHRRSAALWVLLSILGLSWCLNIPGLVHVLRLPGLNMMSHNRLVFICAFAFLALAAIGLEMLFFERVRWRGWMWLPLALLAGLCAWCAYRTVRLPESIASTIPSMISRGQSSGWIHDVDGVRDVQAWFTQYYAAATLWCGLGVVGWVLLRSGRVKQTKLAFLFCTLLAGELLWFGYGRNMQSDPTLYYPSIPVLQSVAEAAPGRMIGYGCLPAALSAMCGLRDVRGYDAVDPAKVVELVLSAAAPNSIKAPYAETMALTPKTELLPDGNIQLPPVLDMLGVRYVIFRGSPWPGTRPVFQGEDYWVLQNSRALPRTFVPQHVELVTNDASRLRKLESTNFAPREVAYVESPVALPDVCRGTAKITDEIPTRINISVQTETPGLVVLCDLWDKGWHAYLNGVPVPVLRANHAVRGVIVPAGSHALQFKYEPASFTWGLRLAGFAAVILLSWLGISLWRENKPGPVQSALP